MQVLPHTPQTGVVQRPHAALEKEDTQPIPLLGYNAAEEKKDYRGSVRINDQVGKSEFGETWEVKGRSTGLYSTYR